jgi:hypothetical protein
MKFNVLIMMTSGVTTHFRGQPFAVVMGVDGFLFSGFIPSFEPALEHQKKQWQPSQKHLRPQGKIYGR